MPVFFKAARPSSLGLGVVDGCPRGEPEILKNGLISVDVLVGLLVNHKGREKNQERKEESS